jgi:O-antigen ligase
MISLLRAAALASIFFLLPYSDWIARTVGDVPFGIANLVLLFAGVLWASGRISLGRPFNPFKAFTVFVAITIVGIGMGLMFDFGSATSETLTLAKREVTLLLLYFVPLAFLRDRKEFGLVFAAFLAINLLTGYHVLSTGVLGGSAFNDSKRGFGPFGTSYWGSDVAGAYLAQMAMFFVAGVLSDTIPLVARGACGAGGAVVFLGILATYSRGGLLATVVGTAVMLTVQRFSPKALILAALLSAAAFAVVPASVATRVSETTDDEGELDESSSLRFLYSRAALSIFTHYPLGVGTGQVRAAMSQFIPRVATDERGYGLWVDPHNGFMYTLVAWGVPGLATFVWALGSAFVAGARIQRDRSAPGIYRVYGLGMTGFVASCATCNMFYANFYKDLVLGSLVLCLGMAAFACGDWQEAEEERPESAPGEKARRRPLGELDGLVHVEGSVDDVR